MKITVTKIIALASAIVAGLMAFANALDPSIIDIFK